MPDARIDPGTTATPADPSPYIRTYAKDVAALSAKNGTLNTAPAPEPKQKPKKPAKVKKSHSFFRPDQSMVVDATPPPAPPANLSDLQAAAERVDPQLESDQEVEGRIKSMGSHDSPDVLQSIALPRIGIGDIIPAPSSSLQNTPFPPKSLSEAVAQDLPAPVIPASLSVQNTATVAEAESERAAILERLRAKVASNTTEPERPVPPPPDNLPTFQPTEVAPPTFVPPPAAPPAPAPIVEVVAPPEPLVEIPPLPQPLPPVPAPIPPPFSPLPASPGMIHDAAPAPFHSYSSDFADRIDTEHASTFSVLAAQENARPVPQAYVAKKSPLLPIAVGVVLILIGIGGVYAAYIFMTNKGPVSILPSVPSLIVTDSQVALTGNSLLQSLAQQAAQTLPDNSVELTYIKAATTTDQGVAEASETGGALITALNLPAPDILLRAIDPASTVGIVHAGSETRAFFILRVNSYERSFAGMLDWESNIDDNLSLLYPLYPSVAVIPSSTATGSVPVETTATVSPQGFTDEVVDNHDARVLKDTAGNSLIIYGYADKQTLIIARDEAAFDLLVGRLQASQQ